MLHTNDNTEQTVHVVGSTLNQETPITNNSNGPVAGVAAAAVIAEAEQGVQGSTLEPELVALHDQGEAIPALISLQNPLLVPGQIAPAPFIAPALAPVLAPAPPVAPTANVDLNINLDANLNPNAAEPTLMGSLHGVEGIQFPDNDVPEDPAAEVPAGQNIQEPTVPLEHVVPNEAALPHAPFVQLFAPAQAMPAVDVVVQPFVPGAGDNPVQQPLLGSLRGLEGIQFEDEGEDDDH